MFRKRAAADPDAYRMSLGEHLEELRGCVARSLIALVVACLACIWPSKYLLEIIARPVVLALRRYQQPDTFLATSPVEAILVYIKVVLIFGLIIAGPYILYQIWSFVAAGLYRHERKWVYHLVPTSIGLFLAGVVFMYFFALLVSLKFLIGFSGWLPQPSAQPTFIEERLLGMQREAAPESQPGIEQAPILPLLTADPADPPIGSTWVNMPEGKLKVRWPSGTYSYQLLRDDRRAMVTTHFRIGEYLSFVLILTIAFGTAFQMPLVVLFLIRSGIVPVDTFRKYRKIVILAIVFVAGILAPPDFLSHIMLSLPMWLLF
ncbi:MAG: twin-arginine translocase subunit TatC, partial [Planctomycetota bacterium]